MHRCLHCASATMMGRDSSTRTIMCLSTDTMAKRLTWRGTTTGMSGTCMRTYLHTGLVTAGARVELCVLECPLLIRSTAGADTHLSAIAIWVGAKSTTRAIETTMKTTHAFSRTISVHMLRFDASSRPTTTPCLTAQMRPIQHVRSILKTRRSPISPETRSTTHQARRQCVAWL